MNTIDFNYLVDDFYRFTNLKPDVLKEQKLEHLIDAFITYYQDKRVANCSPNDGDDMLLFYVGINNIEEKKYFMVRVSRQVYFGHDDGSNEVYHLILEAHYAAKQNVQDIIFEEFWCNNTNEVDYFRIWIKETEIYDVVRNKKAIKIAIKFEKQ